MTSISITVSGGPKEYGIPDIDKPKFVAAKHADFFTSQERVQGVVIDVVVLIKYPMKV